MAMKHTREKEDRGRETGGSKRQEHSEREGLGR